MGAWTYQALKKAYFGNLSRSLSNMDLYFLICKMKWLAR